jgi:hypothetical protein
MKQILRGASFSFETVIRTTQALNLLCLEGRRLRSVMQSSLIKECYWTYDTQPRGYLHDLIDVPSAYTAAEAARSITLIPQHVRSATYMNDSCIYSLLRLLVEAD